jgi:hypothetical protein
MEILITFAVLDEMIEYIEGMEQAIDGEWGSCRNLKQLIEDGYMPKLYKTLLALKNN